MRLPTVMCLSSLSANSTGMRGVCHDRPLVRLLHFPGSDTVAHWCLSRVSGSAHSPRWHFVFVFPPKHTKVRQILLAGTWNWGLFFLESCKQRISHAVFGEIHSSLIAKGDFTENNQLETFKESLQPHFLNCFSVSLLAFLFALYQTHVQQSQQFRKICSDQMHIWCVFFCLLAVCSLLIPPPPHPPWLPVWRAEQLPGLYSDAPCYSLLSFHVKRSTKHTVCANM